MSGALTVAILALNEARNLPRCLDHIPAGYPIVVLDSGSTDATRDIALQRGARVYVNPWPGYAAQRNFALERCDIDTEWTLYIDADEVFPRLFFDWFERWRNEASSQQVDAVMVPSILIFRGERLLHAPGYPIYHSRLLRTATARWAFNKPDFQEKITTGARLHTIDIPYDHYFYDGNLLSWMQKQVRYAGLEASLEYDVNAALTTRARISRIFGRSLLRVPLRFIYHYFVRSGFRDGRPGFEYALMYAWVESTKYVLNRINNPGASSSEQ